MDVYNFYAELTRLAHLQCEQQDILESMAQYEASHEHKEQSERAAKARILRNLPARDLREIFGWLCLYAPKHHAEALTLLSPEQQAQLMDEIASSR